MRWEASGISGFGGKDYEDKTPCGARATRQNALWRESYTTSLRVSNRKKDDVTKLRSLRLRFKTSVIESSRTSSRSALQRQRWICWRGHLEQIWRFPRLFARLDTNYAGCVSARGPGLGRQAASPCPDGAAKNAPDISTTAFPHRGGGTRTPMGSPLSSQKAMSVFPLPSHPDGAYLLIPTGRYLIDVSS